jgi:hypothetical protein
MDKKIMEIVATLALVAVLAVVLISNLGKKKPRPVKPPSPMQVSETAPAAVPYNAPGSMGQTQAGEIPVLGEAKSKLQKERASKPWGRDPFVRVKTLEAGSRTSSLELKGISIGQDKKGFALINQEIVRVGDKIEGCEVLSIEKNRVLLQKGGQNFYLKLPEEQIEGIVQKEVSK